MTTVSNIHNELSVIEKMNKIICNEVQNSPVKKYGKHDISFAYGVVFTYNNVMSLCIDLIKRINDNCKKGLVYKVDSSSCAYVGVKLDLICNQLFSRWENALRLNDSIKSSLNNGSIESDINTYCNSIIENISDCNIFNDLIENTKVSVYCNNET